MPEVLDEEKEIRMSEERKKDEDVERLKKELNEWIDHRIADNNAFISSPKKETLSLLFVLYFPSWLFAAHGYGAS